jgi:hypothetical protein
MPPQAPKRAQWPRKINARTPSATTPSTSHRQTYACSGVSGASSDTVSKRWPYQPRTLTEVKRRRKSGCRSGWRFRDGFAHKPHGMAPDRRGTFARVFQQEVAESGSPQRRESAFRGRPCKGFTRSDPHSFVGSSSSWAAIPTREPWTNSRPSSLVRVVIDHPLEPSDRRVETRGNSGPRRFRPWSRRESRATRSTSWPNDSGSDATRSWLTSSVRGCQVDAGQDGP